MSNIGTQLEMLESACKALKENEGTSNWEWEGRMDAALSVYKAEDEPKVRLVLDEHFKASWNSGNMSEAPTEMQKLVNSLGGLRGGQEMLASDPDLDLLVAVALWPWGGGARTSIRLWFLPKNVSDEQKSDLQARFRSWFQ